MKNLERVPDIYKTIKTDIPQAKLHMDSHKHSHYLSKQYTNPVKMTRGGVFEQKEIQLSKVSPTNQKPF